MAFDLEAARKAGYTDAEIAAHLAKTAGFDLKGAKSAGYADTEIIARLVKQTAGMQPGAAIPGAEGEPARVAAAQAAPGPTMMQRAVGAGEAALATATGAVGGALGMIGGTAKGMAAAVLDGSFGTPQAAQMVEQAAAQGAQALTYAPRTETGQDYTQAVGGVMQQLLPVAGLTPQMGMLQQAAGQAGVAAPLARAGAAQALQTAAGAVPGPVRAAAARVVEAGRAAVDAMRPGQAAEPAAARFGSVGAAGVDAAAQRVATADALPVPIKLTKGQATRDFEVLRFEGETAKNPSLGQPLRDRSAQQNAALAQNFEALIDESGAKATSAIETGRGVVDPLTKAAAVKKNEYRVKYQQADKAGEMLEPVSLAPLADYLNKNRAGRTSAPILSTIADELKVKGVGDGALSDGTVVAGDATLGQAEAIRKAVNRFVKDTDPNDMRVGIEIKKVIDQITEGKGGELYKDARKARQRYAQLFEDNAIVRDLLKTRRGTADRQVALEDVVRRTVLNGDRESLGMLRRTLQTAGGAEGAQAWKELQGATVRHLLDEATKGVGTDVSGNPIFSAAKLNNSIRAMDVDGRLDFMLTKRGAQTVRDLNEISKVVLTLPPGAVNTSNTASVLLAALAEAGTYGSLAGLPLPVMTGLRQLSIYVKDRRIRQRVQETLRDAGSKPRGPRPPEAAPRPSPAAPAPGSTTLQ